MDSLELRQGSLDLLVLKALSWGTMHGYSILGWLRRTTDGELKIEDAALYPALHRMEARGLIQAEWGVSENNRRAKFYQLTAEGERVLRAETESWRRYVTVVAKVLNAAAVQTA
jgi:PadR family transcriptional regulator PadR